MERQNQSRPERVRPTNDGPPSGDNLDQQRSEINQLLQASDHLFDSIHHIQAHQYLEQNVQSGGQ